MDLMRPKDAIEVKWLEST